MERRLTFSIFASCMMILAGISGAALVASGQTAHPNAKTLPVQFSGWPWYIEDYVTGGTVSDYGSHYGVKANLTDSTFGKMMYYTCFSSYVNGELDRQAFDFRSGGASVLDGATRTVEFSPWGWTETAAGAKGVSEMSAAFVETDVLLLSFKFTNLGQSSEISPVLSLSGEFGKKTENMMAAMFIAWQIPITLGTENGDNTVTIYNFENAIVTTNPEAAATMLLNTTTYRTFAPSFNIASLSQSPSIGSYSYEIVGEASNVPAGETKEFWVAVGFDQSAAGSQARAQIGKSLAGSSASARIDAVKADWQAYLDSLTVPHTDSPEFTDLYYQAMTALRMELYAPRNLMTQWCSVPCKPHFNFFWAWDTPFHIVGHSEMKTIMGMDGTEMAEQNMYTQFTGQDPVTGMIYIVIDDGFSAIFKQYTDPPVHGWALSHVYEHEIYNNPERAKSFIQDMYDVSARYINFWETERDTNFDGLLEYNSAMETGWDDTPRYATVNPTGTNAGGFMLMVGVDAIDLNSWMYMYANAMSSWANDLGDSQGASEWNAKAENLASLVESKMWSESDGCWYDINHLTSPSQFVNIATPAIWFPAFAGLSSNETRIRSVIERHLLNPEEFFGQYPIPTVAYNSDSYEPTTNGYYWRGQIWLITAYTALETLYKYGYEAEAQELKTRLFSMMANKGGIYETYDSQTGEVGWGSNGVGDPSCFQFGWSSMFTSQMALERYQRTRYVMSGENEFTGYVKTAKALDGAEIYSVDTGEYEVPHVSVKSTDGKSIAESSKLQVEFTDPYGAISGSAFKARIKGATFDAALGKTYGLDAETGKVSEIMEKKSFIPGFEMFALAGALAAALVLLRKKR